MAGFPNRNCFVKVGLPSLLYFGPESSMSRWYCTASLLSLALLALAAPQVRAGFLFVSSIGTSQVLEYNATTGELFQPQWHKPASGASNVLPLRKR
jgi:hypothetical protein